MSPSLLIQFQIGNTTRSKELETAKLDYGRALQQNQMYVLQKSTEMESLKLEIQKVDLTTQRALDKLKVKLQTSLFSTQMASCKKQHESDGLKQVIDSLKGQK